ncbi:hypothetical protein ERJ75_001345300 [Trypanosoma vivax]|nr:hypothetical protein ERJ75_001345300 [Trypanosoma vivax]
MKTPSTRRNAFRHITEAELDVALRELSSGTARGNDNARCEKPKQLGRVAKKCVPRLFNCSLRTAQVRVNSMLSEDIGLTCDVPHGSVLGQLPFIVTVASLSSRLNCIPWLLRGLFAGDLTIVCASADLSEIQQTIQQGLDCSTNGPAQYYMEVSSGKTWYTLFGVRETNLLSLKVGETALKKVCATKLLGLTMQPHKGLSKHALNMKAAADMWFG